MIDQFPLESIVSERINPENAEEKSIVISAPGSPVPVNVGSIVLEEPLFATLKIMSGALTKVETVAVPPGSETSPRLGLESQGPWSVIVMTIDSIADPSLVFVITAPSTSELSVSKAFQSPFEFCLRYVLPGNGVSNSK